MQRTDAPEILDSDACTPCEVQRALAVIGSINRKFGGVVTTQKMVERVAEVSGKKNLSLLEAACGTGDLPAIIRENVARRGIDLSVTLLDRADSHLLTFRPGALKRAASRGCGLRAPAIVADALSLPFSDNAFDLVSCNLFAHHLMPEQFTAYVRDALRASRIAVLVNDLVRHPLHLGLVYASYPLMRCRVAWLDGLTSVRRAYVPREIRWMISSALPALSDKQIEISRHYLFRMGVIIWKNAPTQER